MADNNDNDIIIEDEGKVTRWIPATVVTVALAGFFGLAWYAYQSGTKSINEDELVVVEADKSPMKEKPLDPGGMKFPNQDKTVFETFSGNPQAPAHVERVMPAPEEPMSKHIDTSETSTWVNDKLKKPTEASQEPVAAEPPKPVAAKAPVDTVSIIKEVSPSSGKAAADVRKSDQIVTHVAKPKEPAATPVVKEAATPTAKPAAVEVKPTASFKEKLAAAPAKSSGSAKVQLGAYASEEEARASFERIKKTVPELADKTVYVVKADLGSKGIYYRLRVGGIGDAKAFCGRLSAKGQACMPVP